MKFKKFVNEAVNTQDLLTENIDTPTIGQDEMYRIYAPIEKHISEGRFDVAKSLLDELTADLDAFEDSRKNKLFKMRSFIEFQRRKLQAYYEQIEAQETKNESLEDIDKRCETCNTLLNDGGTCPKCDDGEEDLEEGLSVREKLKAAFPELNFDNKIDDNIVTEELSNKEKLLRAYPELNFDTDSVKESVESDTCSVDDVLCNEDNNSVSNKTNEGLTAREKLKAAYPELNFDASHDSTSSFDTIVETLDDSGDYMFDYDDDYEMDDVEQDRAHAALYGGDRMYCDCGTKLAYDEQGSYCPHCNPKDPEDAYTETYDNFFDDDTEGLLN